MRARRAEKCHFTLCIDVFFSAEKINFFHQGTHMIFFKFGQIHANLLKFGQICQKLAKSNFFAFFGANLVNFSQKIWRKILGSNMFHFWGQNFWIHKFWGQKSFIFGVKVFKIFIREGLELGFYKLKFN